MHWGANMKVAVAGLGWWGKQIIGCLDRSQRFEVLYGIDPNPPADIDAFRAIHRFKLAASLDTALADPAVDAVILATPHAQHEEQALRVIAAGKDLFCEKPLAMSGDGARRVVEACRQAGRVLGIGHERRYEPAFEELQRLIDAGALGRLLFFEANVSHDQFTRLSADNWRLSPDSAPAGMMTAVGIHLTDLMVHFAGPAREVRARTASLKFAPPAEDFVTASIEFASGVRATLSSLSITPFYARFTCFGDTGWAEIASEANIDWGRPTTLTVSDTPGERRQTVFQATDTVRENFESWANAVEGRAPYRFSGEELVENIRLFEAIVLSSRQGGAPKVLA
jgi:predicted dehydrogenase